MKYYVKVDEQLFEVEISDLRSRPILAIVDGVPFEVWPESSEQTAPKLTSFSTQNEVSTAQSAAKGSALPTSAAIAASTSTVKAPLPGVIISISVKPDDEVKSGQELCVIEAMKMRNAIRASRAGKIAAIDVSAGQTVNHGDLLMEYAE